MKRDYTNVKAMAAIATAFDERVSEFYRSDPDCAEARKHSFGHQRNVAKVKAMEEYRGRIDPDLLDAVAARVGEIQDAVHPDGCAASVNDGTDYDESRCNCQMRDHNGGLRWMKREVLATITAMKGEAK